MQGATWDRQFKKVKVNQTQTLKTFSGIGFEANATGETRKENLLVDFWFRGARKYLPWYDLPWPIVLISLVSGEN